MLRSLVGSEMCIRDRYVTMSQEVVEEEEVHFLDLAFRAQIELRNVKVKVTLR